MKHNSSENHSLISLYDKVCLQSGANVAIKGSGYSFSYSDFYNISCHFAGQLTREGVASKEIVALYIDRSPEMLAGIFGILRNGSAYLPLDVSDTSERTKSILADAGVKYVVTSDHLAEQISELGYTPIVPEMDTTVVEKVEHTEIEPHDAAYILFTSGSTGKPKGVVVSHRSVLNLLEYMQNRYPLNAGEVVLFKSPYTFDGSVWEIFGWMMMGGTLCVADAGVEKDARLLVETIKNEGVQFLFFVPSMLNAFLEYCAVSRKSNQLSSLKWVSVGGEVLPVKMVNRFYELLGEYNSRLINVYGPTETTVYATTYCCQPNQLLKKVPIGEAVTNNLIYILNDRLEPVPEGEEGEICIGGVGVAHGYLNRPELTAEKFIPNRFTNSGLLYRTGDIGRQLESGLYDFVGRRDFQVKLRGQRIELEEIEFALHQLQNLKDSVVAFSKDRHGDACLVAYVTPLEIDNQAPDDLFFMADESSISMFDEELSKKLPRFMIPTEWVVCREFPLTRNGKVDRNALPAVSELRDRVEKKVFEPANPQEKLILKIWTQILGVQSASADDDFIQSGGHSLKAVQMISEIIRKTGVEIQLKEFYHQLTLRRLCDLIATAIRNTMIEELQPKTHVARTVYPLTPVQSEMWLVNKFDESGITHNIQVEFTINGVFDESFFIRKFTETVKAEEIFRSVFPTVQGNPVQIVKDHVDVELPIIDLSFLDDETKAEKYAQIARQNGQKIFELDSLPLFSFKLIRWSDGESRLLMAVHHIIFDGWSLYLFMKRLHHRLLSKTEKKVEYSQGEYVTWLRKELDAGRRQTELAYWEKQLDGIPPRLDLLRKPDSNEQRAGRQGDRIWWDFSADTTAGIGKVAQKLGVTPFVLMMSAYQIVLSVASGGQDIVVGTPVAQRSNPLVSDLLGYFTNMVSIRSRIEKGDTFDVFVRKCNQAAIDAFSHSLVSFGEVVKHLFEGHNERSNPVYQAIFVMQNWPHEVIKTHSFEVSQREIGNFTSKIDLLFNVEESNGAYVCWLEYDTELFNADLISKLSSGITYVIEQVIQETDVLISSLKTDLTRFLRIGTPFSAILVGEGALAVQCLDILKNRKVDISAVVSTDESVLHHAAQWHILAVKDICDLSDFKMVDYIFSINNGLLLTPEFLSLAGCVAINYHDSPLPRYAGMYATHHALLNGESQWAISWHRITAQIDGGDVFLSVPVSIYSVDTAFSLNNRCFEVSVDSFYKLIDGLVTNTLMPVSQNAGLRTYYAKSNRPKGMGFISGRQTTDDLSRIIRSCDTGYSDNEFLLPALLIGSKLYFVLSAQTRKGNFGEPGEIFSYKGGWGMSCQDGCLIINRMADAFSVEVLLDKVLKEGLFVDEPTDEFIEEIAAAFPKSVKYEPYWKELLANSDFLHNPVMRSPKTSVSESLLEIPITLFDGVTQLFHHEVFDAIAALASIYTARLCGKRDGLVLTDRNEFLNNQYFANWRPAKVSLDEQDTLHMSLKKQFAHFGELNRSHTFCSSLFMRYSSLKGMGMHLAEVAIVRDGFDCSNLNPDALIFVVKDSVLQIRNASVSFLNSFASFVSRAIENLEINIFSIPLFDSTETYRQFLKINESVCESGSIVDVVSQIERAVSQYPQTSAIWCQGQTVTYRQLWSDAAALSDYFISEGLIADSVVAVAIPRSYEYFVSVLATLISGAAFVPIDVSLSDARQQYMVEDSGAQFVLVSTDDYSTTHPVPVINMKSIGRTVPSRADYVPVSPQSVAYIIYTSGSTGNPKGVKISREALANFVSGAISLYDVSSDDRILQFSNLSFDASIEEIFLSFCTGATLYLRDDTLLSPSEFLSFSANHNLTVWDLPTGFWRQIIAYKLEHNTHANLTLRVVIVGGEALQSGDVEAWKALSPMHRLFNSYGPTEATVVALACEISARKRYRNQIPIGRPLPRYQVLIVDDSGLMVPDGVVGELLIAGVSVANGYASAVEYQEKAFIRLTLPDGTQSKCYKTGDLIYSDEKGMIYFVGRKDEQIKIRGYRVEPEGVAHHISAIAGIESCAVVHFVRKSGDTALAAFYTSKTGEVTDSVKIRQILTGRIPYYMIPALILPIDFIPLTSNGKTDKRKLTQIASKSGVSVKSGSADMLHEESTRLKKLMDADTFAKFEEIAMQLLHIAKELTGEEYIGIEHDLHYSGFDSLLFIRLIVEIEAHFNFRISISEVYKHPTISELAHLILDRRFVRKSNAVTCIQEGVPGETPLFLIWGAGQQVIKFNELALKLSKHIPVYALHAPIVNGEVDIPDTLESLAWFYLNEIKRLFPEQKISLAGYSFGGFVVFEIARQMMQSGNSPQQVFIIDASSVFVRYEGQPDYLYNTVVLRCKLIWFMKNNPLRQLRMVLKNISDYIDIIRVKQQVATDHVPIEEPAPALEFNDLLQYKAHQLTHQYVIRPLDIKIHLLTSKSHIKYGGRDMLWSRYAKNGVLSHFISCYHGEIFFHENAAEVAAWLEQNLH